MTDKREFMPGAGEEAAVAEWLGQLDLETLMRRAIELAQHARDTGGFPFGTLLVDSTGRIVLEAVNTVAKTGDATHHAEQIAISEASRKFTREELGRMVLVTSTEPCAMCAGAAFWAGIRAVVYGVPVDGFGFTSDVPPPVITLACRAVFESAPAHPTTVIGPFLEEEARVPHEGFWEQFD